MATRVSYPVEVKMQAIKMRLAGVPVREVMEELFLITYLGLKIISQRIMSALYKNDLVNHLPEHSSSYYYVLSPFSSWQTGNG